MRLSTKAGVSHGYKLFLGSTNLEGIYLGLSTTTEGESQVQSIRMIQAGPEDIISRLFSYAPIIHWFIMCTTCNKCTPDLIDKLSSV